jgi:hypothetical protein
MLIDETKTEGRKSRDTVPLILSRSRPYVTHPPLERSNMKFVNNNDASHNNLKTLVCAFIFLQSFFPVKFHFHLIAVISVRSRKNSTEEAIYIYQEEQTNAFDQTSNS